jgi:BTB/POZ domain
VYEFFCLIDDCDIDRIFLVFIDLCFYRDVDETAMDILIDFCYTSNIVVEESNVQTLLPAACLLQLAEIQVIRMEMKMMNIVK